MIKNLPLYGLCFNLGIVFGYPTQAKLEAFLAAQGGKIEVTRETIGKSNFPVKVTLKDEDAKKAWKAFSKQHGGYLWYEIPSEEQAGMSEAASKEGEEVEPLPAEAQVLEVASEGDQSGGAESSAISPEAPEDVADSVDYYPEPKKRTEEEMRVRFLKYSREATEAELALVAGWGIKGLRFVDFDSIVSGLDDETQKEEARRLIQKENKTELFEAIDKWVEERDVRSTYSLKILISGSEEPVDGLPYKLNPEVVKTFKESLKTTLKGMARCKSSRETLVLSLVLLKDLKLVIGPEPGYDSNIIEFYTTKYENVNIQVLYHELNHALHYQLGIEAPELSMLDDCNSKLECGLLRVLGNELFTSTEPIQVPSIAYFLWIEGAFDPTMPTFVEVLPQEYFKKLSIFLLWDTPEEIWNIIGFTDVGGNIYVNHMSDINLLQIPRMFHGRDRKFTDAMFLGLNNGFCTDLSASPTLTSFLEEMEETVTRNIAALCPTPKAWKVWLKLQGREDADVGYFTTPDGTTKEFVEEVKIIGLIEGE